MIRAEKKAGCVHLTLEGDTARLMDEAAAAVYEIEKRYCACAPQWDRARGIFRDWLAHKLDTMRKADEAQTHAAGRTGGR